MCKLVSDLVSVQNPAVPVRVEFGCVSGVPARGLLQLLKSERHTDLSLVVEGQVVRAHRAIVASQCDYFDRSEFSSVGDTNSINYLSNILIRCCPVFINSGNPCQNL